MAGSGAVIVLNEDTCIVAAILRMTEFYRDESCGKCTPCREGTYWLTEILERREHGHGKMQDIDKLADICSNISGRYLCPLGDAATSSIVSGILVVPRGVWISCKIWALHGWKGYEVCCPHVSLGLAQKNIWRLTGPWMSSMSLMR